MDALILAAGFGSRLESLSPSKPLAHVHGVSLLELSLRQLASVGVTRAVIATGHRADEIDQAVQGMGSRLGLEIITQRVDDWRKPNGYSVLAGASILPRKYVLVMCDHILSAPLLRGLVSADAEDRDVTLAIDRTTSSPLIDPDDATWVELCPNGFINRIGKNIPSRDAVDCGAFLATPALADAMRSAIAKGLSGSLSDGMQVLADRGRAATYDIGDAWWIDVDDPRAHSLAEAELDEHFVRLGSKTGIANPTTGEAMSTLR